MKEEIILGDCLVEMKKIPDKSIDMILTSPPYDNLRTYNGSLDWGEHIWKPVIQELFRIIKDGGVVVWVVGDATIKGGETGTSFKQALYFKEVGFNLHDTVIYQKTSSSLPDKTRYSQIFEYMFVFSKGKISTFNPIIDKPNKQAGSVNPTKKRNPDGTVCKTEKRYTIPPIGKRLNIWIYEVGYNKGTKDKFVFQHPATFPEKLAHDHIISWSNEGDTILDPFAGSGTVGKMAKQLNRNYILIEKEPEYVEIIKKRLTQ